MSKHIYSLFFLLIAGFVSLISFAPAAEAWGGVGVVISGPAYYYPPPYYPYPPPVAYVPPSPYYYGPPPPPAPAVASNYAPREQCRKYSHNVIIAGKEQKVHGRACHEPDGSWRIVN